MGFVSKTKEMLVPVLVLVPNTYCKTFLLQWRYFPWSLTELIM